VLIFDRPAANMSWYFASGWKEAAATHERIRERHGGNPDWTEWLSRHEQAVLGAKLSANPPSAQDIRDIVWWPNPGSMLSPPERRRGVFWRDQGRRDFLAFLNDWYYGRLSGDSHLSYLGLAERGGIFFGDVPEPELPQQEETRELYRSRVVFTSVAIFVAVRGRGEWT
jgi:hypothetical protein